MIELSIVIPIYNDELVIEELFSRLDRSLSNFNFSIEIILINDGSQDNSVNEIIKNYEVLKSYDLKLIQLTRNFGQMAAISAGSDNAKGIYTVLIDSDLQDRPEDIISLYNKIKESNVPMVIAERKKRDDSFLKKLGSQVFHFLSTSLINIKFPKNVGVFRIFETSSYKKLSVLRDTTTPPISLMYWAGIKYETIALERDKRFAGESGYSLLSLISLALDRIFSFSTTPIRMATYIGIFFSLTSFIMATILIAKKIFLGGILPGWTTTVVLVLTSTGINLFFLGIIGEYLSRVYQETKKRPRYIIDSISTPNKEAKSPKTAA